MLWETIMEENSSDFTMDSVSLPRQLGDRRLNVNMSMHEMPIDEVSFYDDHEQLQLASSPSMRRQGLHSLTESSQLMGLLSPEGSPQRFQIVEKPLANKFVRPSDHRPQKLLEHFTNVAGTHTSSTTSSNTSPKSLRMFHSLSSSGSMESSMDDEYMELFEMESLEQLGSHMNVKFPSDLNSLISGNIKSSSSASPATSGHQVVPSVAKTPEMRRPSVRRCLSLTDSCHQNQPKTPELLKQVQETAATSSSTTPFSSRLTVERNNCMPPTHISCFKRPDPPSANCSPVQPKRYRGDEKENVHYYIATSSSNATTIKTIPTFTHIIRPPLRKCMSMNDAEIMSALARSECKDEPDLIGDFSKAFALPLIEGRHRDLKSISSDTVARLLNGDFDDQVASYKIIDCRYPYEYEGGHIRGAQNIYTQEQIIKEFLTLQQKTEHQQLQQGQVMRTDLKRSIIIFHCEFSSERGPKLSRFLRNNDRARNTNSYPTLDYPEIYLLHNGYKDFYETHSELCEPIAYRPMLEPAYSEAYRHFRAKSKSWNGDGPCGGGGGATSRLKKSRSRLML